MSGGKKNWKKGRHKWKSSHWKAKLKLKGCGKKKYES